MLLGVTVATLAIFGTLIAGITWRLRNQLRGEVLQREARAIHAVAEMQLRSSDAGLQLAQFGAEFAIDDTFAAVLRSSELHGVMAVQYFDPRGALRKAQPIAPDDAAATRWWPAGLRDAQARYLADGTLELVSPQLALKTPTHAALPLLDVAVPLRGGDRLAESLGVARYWIDGEPVRAEFARIDARLWRQLAVAFIGGSALVGLVLALAFSRLAEANRRLRAQSADLARANEELDFAAKTGALGAISAHLIHGLKNPLAGLEGFVAETASAGSDAPSGEACRTAMETTQRLRLLVNEVTTVLRDETDGAGDYGVPVREVVDAARARAVVVAERAAVQLEVAALADAQIAGRTANLAGLVLANLLANAIEASPAGGRVTIEALRSNGRIDFVVTDRGSGLPAEVSKALFRPVRSTKRGGGGVGLAISHRLARHAAGELQLVRSDDRGTVFRLTVPAL